MRGYQKRIIYIKNTGSRAFEEAYFVLSPDGEAYSREKRDLVGEANKIIEENFKGRRLHFERRHLFLLLSFISGAALSALVFLLVILFA